MLLPQKMLQKLKVIERTGKDCHLYLFSTDQSNTRDTEQFIIFPDNDHIQIKEINDLKSR